MSTIRRHVLQQLLLPLIYFSECILLGLQTCQCRPCCLCTEEVIKQILIEHAILQSYQNFILCRHENGKSLQIDRRLIQTTVVQTINRKWTMTLSLTLSLSSFVYLLVIVLMKATTFKVVSIHSNSTIDIADESAIRIVYNCIRNVSSN